MQSLSHSLKHSRSDSHLLKNDVLKSKSPLLKRSRSDSDMLKTNILASEDPIVKQILENISENYFKDAKIIRRAIDYKDESVLYLSEIPEIPSELEKHLTHIKTLKLENFTGKTFINDFTNIENVTLDECQNLIKLNISKAKEIDISDCKTLEEVNASEALYINAPKSVALKKVNGPEVKKIDVSEATNLMELTVPKAKKIKASKTGLMRLDAPEAEKIDVSEATNLMELTVPKAKKIKASNTALTKLDAPEVVNSIIIANMRDLTDINLPNANHVTLLNCENLKSFNIPKATHAKISNCKNLIKLDAPEVIKGEIKCFASLYLKILSVPKMEGEVEIQNCPVLQKVDVPLAKFLNISDCSILEEVKCPQNIVVYISSCHVLKKVDASSVNRLHIKNCAMLEEIKLSQNKHISIFGCPSFEKLDICSVQDVINVNHCINLREINISNSPNIDVSDCMNLEILNASDSRNIKINHCVNLNKINIPKCNALWACGINTDTGRKIVKDFISDRWVGILRVQDTLTWDEIPEHMRSAERDKIYIDIRPLILTEIDLPQNIHTQAVNLFSSFYAIKLQEKISSLEKNNAQIEETQTEDKSVVEKPKNLGEYVDHLSTEGAEIVHGIPNQAFVNATAQRFMKNIPHEYTKDALSKIDIKTFLDLWWKAANNDDLHIKDITKEDAFGAIIQGLYEIQRGGNIDEKHKDDNKENDAIIFHGGTFNKIYEKMCGTFNKIYEKMCGTLKDIEFRFITQRTMETKRFASFVDEETRTIGLQAFYVQVTQKLKERTKNIKAILDEDGCLKFDNYSTIRNLTEIVNELLPPLEIFKIDIDKELEDFPENYKNDFREKMQGMNRQIKIWASLLDDTHVFIQQIIGYFKTTPLDLEETSQSITEIGESSGTKDEE